MDGTYQNWSLIASGIVGKFCPQMPAHGSFSSLPCAEVG